MRGRSARTHSESLGPLGSWGIKDFREAGGMRKAEALGGPLEDACYRELRRMAAEGPEKMRGRGKREKGAQEEEGEEI